MLLDAPAASRETVAKFSEETSSTQWQPFQSLSTFRGSRIPFVFRVPPQQEKARHFGRARILLRLKLRVLGFRSGWLVAGCPAQDPAHKRAEVFLIPKGFAIADLNVFDRRCSNDSGVTLEVALRFAESYRRNGVLSLDIQEFGAQGNNRGVCKLDFIRCRLRLGLIHQEQGRRRRPDAMSGNPAKVKLRFFGRGYNRNRV